MEGTRSYLLARAREEAELLPRPSSSRQQGKGKRKQERKYLEVKICLCRPHGAGTSCSWFLCQVGGRRGQSCCLEQLVPRTGLTWHRGAAETPSPHRHMEPKALPDPVLEFGGPAPRAMVIIGVLNVKRRWEAPALPLPSCLLLLGLISHHEGQAALATI